MQEESPRNDAGLGYSWDEKRSQISILQSERNRLRVEGRENIQSSVVTLQLSGIVIEVMLNCHDINI